MVKDYNNGYKKGQQVLAGNPSNTSLELLKGIAKDNIERKSPNRHYHRGILNALTD